MKITEKQIKDYHAQAEGSLQREIEKDYPEVFKVDLWDKWLVDDGYPEWMSFYEKEQNYVTGLDSSGVWFEQVKVSDPNKSERNKPATHEQILEKLSKEAVKRGYKEGNHKCLTGDTVKGEKIGFEYYSDTNNLYFNRNRIFHDGTWAAIVEPVYEWQYLCRSPSAGVYGVSTAFYTSKKDFNTQNKDRIVISKIKESKRLRK
jgi:hypothetical protein